MNTGVTKFSCSSVKRRINNSYQLKQGLVTQTTQLADRFTSCCDLGQTSINSLAMLIRRIRSPGYELTFGREVRPRWIQCLFARVAASAGSKLLNG